jgi:hypothetical protein
MNGIVIMSGSRSAAFDLVAQLSHGWIFDFGHDAAEQYRRALEEATTSESAVADVLFEVDTGDRPWLEHLKLHRMRGVTSEAAAVQALLASYADVACIFSADLDLGALEDAQRTAVARKHVLTASTLPQCLNTPAAELASISVWSPASCADFGPNTLILCRDDDTLRAVSARCEAAGMLAAESWEAAARSWKLEPERNFYHFQPLCVLMGGVWNDE